MHNTAEKTPDQFAKKRMSSMKQSLAGVSSGTTPQAFNPNPRSRVNKVMISNQDNQNNSTENLFNLIQATKTKNTPVLEPLNKDKHKKADSAYGAAFDDTHMISPREEMGIGLQNKQRM